jgi:hypothetical protein
MKNIKNYSDFDCEYPSSACAKIFDGVNGFVTTRKNGIFLFSGEDARGIGKKNVCRKYTAGKNTWCLAFFFQRKNGVIS